MKQKLITRLVNDTGTRCPVGATAGKLAVMLLVLTLASCATDAPAPGSGRDEHFCEQQKTQVYQHTYDEVFQACQEAIERLGFVVTDMDKDKGTISGRDDHFDGSKYTFSMHVETLNTKPETSITFNGHYNEKWGGMIAVMTLGGASNIAQRQSIANLGRLASEVQQVLATYH
ncbi:MAG: hypothetical protein ABSA12_08920 [Verrucomicrobiia bacterium]